jgi:hypothetical protein
MYYDRPEPDDRDEDIREALCCIYDESDAAYMQYVAMKEASPTIVNTELVEADDRYGDEKWAM